MSMTSEGWIKRKLNGNGIPWNKGISFPNLLGVKNPNYSRVEKKCKECKNVFIVKNYRKEIANFCSQDCAHKNRRNLKNKIDYAIRRRGIYQNWRKSIFERDNYTCQECGVRNRINLGKTVILNVDHIKPLKMIIIDNNLDTIEKMMSCEELWDIKNGRTLCVPCHKKTETYGRVSLYRNGCIASA